ncbi:MAG: acyl-CoA dehydratase activase-related protein [Candidatus Gastranaerophilales bacterium]|nr:acyl-CoA dehydratase activase-related protein [Candidatus Gastranaerophilales bacterium]
MAKDKTNKIKKVAFPHMGTVYVVWSTALKKLGLEAFIPPKTSKKTLSLGAKYSPESICLPYKLVLGNFIEACEGGADAVVMITSPGICRLGEYGRIINHTLSDLKYTTKYIDLNLYGGYKAMYNFLTEISGIKNPFKLIDALIITIKKVFVLDRLEKVLAYYRAREVKHGAAEKIFNKGLDKIAEAMTLGDLKKAEKEISREISKVQVDPTREILHVDLTGEIFLVLDSFSNQNLERELGKLGVQTRRSLTIGSWIKDAITPGIFKKGETHLERAVKFAAPYLKRDIGGDALESVSDVAYADHRGIDGIIHISPFTCMPEIMSQNIFPSMRENCEIPILALIMDEQSGKAGYITRLEAFCDLMRRKKRKAQVKSIK